jgi:two-component system, chemotaxis family, protein-glutamate methylesterase/glutaminase
MSGPSKIRVLIVDDSPVIRRMARDTLSADPEIDVVGSAADPYEARDQIARLSPDVLTLDLEMPHMDGLTFLGLLMERKPMPVVVMSSLTNRGSDFALEAMRLGAVDVIGKPSSTTLLREVGTQLISKVKAAARARVRTRSFSNPATAPGAPVFHARRAPIRRPDPRAAILLGASTGGVEALREVLTTLPGDLPGIAVVQHIPAGFSKAFADRLDTQCVLEVREAVDGDRLLPGTALIAPGNFHMLLQWTGSHHQVRIADGPPVWHQRPAVDLMFKSAADAGNASHFLAGVLTGMGRDGADGLLRLRERGAATFAQDEESSVVYGMPRAAFENGGAQAVLPLDRVASWINQHPACNPRQHVPA